MRRRSWFGLAILVLIQGALVGLYFHKRKHSEPKPFASESLSAREAPTLSFAHDNGVPGTLAELRGKVVLVHFWATWCEPCRVELPGLLERANQLTRDKSFTFIAVAIDDDWNAIRQFFGGNIPANVVLPSKADVHRQFGASTLPDSYLVDASGKVVERYAGARDWTEARAASHLARAIATYGAMR